jgi:hypothetical protein
MIIVQKNASFVSSWMALTLSLQRSNAVITLLFYHFSMTDTDFKKKKEFEDKLKKDTLDPTHNMQDIMNDTSGLTGITGDSNPTNNKGQGFEKNDDVARSMSDEEYGHAIAVAEGRDEPGEMPSLEEQTGQDVEQMSDKTPPEVRGEQSESGDMPEPSADDDTLSNAQAVGLRQDEDSEHPKPLDIASDIDKAEEYQRFH